LRGSSRNGCKTYEDEPKQFTLFIEEYQDEYPEAAECLEEGLKDRLQCFDFDFIDHGRISSVNVLERPAKRSDEDVK